MKRLIGLAAAVMLVGVIIAPAVATATPGNGNGGANSGGWTTYYYNANGNGLGAGAKSGTGATAAFPFLSAPRYAALLATGGNSAVPLGNLSSSSLADSFTISGVTGTFVNNPNRCNGGTGAQVRLYFATGTKVSQYNLWWATTSVVLTGNTTSPATLGPVSLADPSQWYDLYGENGASVPTQFAAATAKVSEVGVSFECVGGFAEGGVTTSNGSGTFASTFSVTANP